VCAHVCLSVICAVCMLSYPQDPLSGIIPRTLSDLFDELRMRQVDSVVKVSFMEIYNEELFDLLSPEGRSSKLRYDDALVVVQYVCLMIA